MFHLGTLIATPSGEIPVQDLCWGSRVFTRNNGVQHVRWHGQRKVITREQTTRQGLPILIRHGALGRDLPEYDLVVSPNHRVLLNSEMAESRFGERDVLMSAKHLTDLDGVDRIDGAEFNYVHVMFDAHEVILANGSWNECFQPSDMSLRGIGDAQRGEILGLFPELTMQLALNKGRETTRGPVKKRPATALLR